MMGGLKGLLDKKRKAAEDEFGQQTSAKRVDIETKRVQRVREQEQAELAQQQADRQQTNSQASISNRRPSLQSRASEQEQLPREEVVRRLRLLAKPVTLFGETDAERAARLRRVQDELQIEDEVLGGGRYNELEQLRRQRKKGSAVPRTDAEPPASAAVPEEEEPADGADAMEAAFKQAAAALRARQEDANLPIDKKIAKYVTQWCSEWEQDLEKRPEHVKLSGPGVQATLMFQQTMAFFKPMYRQLKHGTMVPEMKAGLWMILQNITDRNYLAGYDIFMRLAIGNNPWPIGVTSVGIHERSAREKISHVMNAAHIMNDEATRKYLTAMKRLLTVMQRMYPAAPSRCVDFDAHRDAGRGLLGGGSDKLALLDAEHAGTGMLALPMAPHYVEKDGSIKVPQKWENIVRASEVFKAETRTPPHTPPRTTPPLSPVQADQA